MRTQRVWLVLMVLLVSIGLAVTAQGDPSIWTDKADYAPEETVHISGSGFDPGASLTIKVTRPDGSVVTGDGSFEPWPTAYDTVVVDAEGGFQHDYILDGIEGEYLVEAVVGGEVLAACSFTDAHTYRIKAFKFEDKNGNHVQDSGEGPLSGWKFKLYKHTWHLWPPHWRWDYVATAVTDSNGYADLGERMRHRKYRIVETVKTGWTCNTGAMQEFYHTGIRTVPFGNQKNCVPPTITCPDNITQNNDPGNCSAVVNWSVTATGNPTPTVSCSPASGSTFPVGITTVTCTATNPCGTDTCSFDVTVSDDEDPTITCPGNQTRSTDPGVCSYTAVGGEFDPTSFSDNCPGATISNDYNSSSTLASAVFPKGKTTVTWTVTDTSTNTASCSFDVTVNDNEDPKITCPGNQPRSTDPGVCNYTAVGGEFDPTSFSDNCPGATISNDYNSSSTLASAVFPKGKTTVTWTVTDTSTNTASCSFDVTVNDNEDPKITCPGNQPRSTDPGVCNYTAVGGEFDPTSFSDNCPGATISNDYNSSSTLASAVFPKGKTTVTWTVTDTSTNTASCSFDVTVNDSEDPKITCPGNQSRSTDPGVCNYTAVGGEFDPTSFSDNCPGATISNDYNSSSTLASAVFPKGKTTVTWTVTDTSTNTASCSFDVTVNDNEDPKITCPGNQSRSTDPGVCSYTAVGGEFDPTSFSDNCPGATISNDYNSSSTLASAVFPKGLTTVKWTVTDTSTNTASCSFDVTVNDNEDPKITCPGNQSRSTDPGVCSYTAVGGEFDPTSFSDNCPGATISNDYNSSSTLASAVFPKGKTTVTWTVTDTSTNTASCSFDVTVNDNEDPKITCPGNQSRSTDPGVCSYTAVGGEFDPTSFSDNCPGATISNDYNSSSTLASAVFPKGKTTVTWTVTDTSTNTASCSFDVTVNDSEDPKITCPGNQSRSTDPGVCSYTAVGVELDPTSFSDNCPGATISNDYNSSSTLASAVFPKGLTTVKWTVTDTSANTASCSFDVTVNDNEDPKITCPGNQSRSTDPGVCSYTAVGGEFDPTSFSDNCPGATISNDYNSSSTLASAVFPKGKTTVTWTVTDTSTNTASCSFDVTVNDNEDPKITCPGNQSRSTDPGVCSYTAVGGEFDPTSFSDNCPGATISNDYNSSSTLASAVFPKGKTTVTWTVTDTSTNTASCSFDVTVNDSEDPKITCPGNQSRSTDPGVCSYTAVGVELDPTSFSDNCPGATISNDYNSSSTLASAVFPKGLTTVKWTVTDTSANTASCSFDVTVNDNEDPKITCPGNQSRSTDPGVCSYTAVGVELDPTSFSDNCPGATISNDYNSSSTLASAVFPKGLTTVKWTVTDTSANTASCSFDVTVNDNEDPKITCPADIAVNSDLGVCGALVNYTVTSSDNCPGETIAQTGGLASGSTFPVGTMTNTFVVTDAAGNTATCSFDVTVTDNKAPTISGCPGDITQDSDAGDCSAVVTWTAPTAADNCAINTFTSDYSPGDTFPVGTTHVTYTALDIHGNSSTCEFDVTVNDVEPPTTVFTSTPPNPDNNPDPYFEWTATDNNTCTVPANLVYSNRLDGGTWSAWSAPTFITLTGLTEGAHTFEVRAMDEAGNIETTASYTWLLDLTPPVITIITPEDQAEYGLNDVVLADWRVSDALSGLASVAGTMPSGEAIDTTTQGFHDFTVTATDLAGNTNMVTVIYRVVYEVHPGGAAGGGGGAEGEGGAFLDKSIAGGGGAVGITTLEAVYTIGDVIHVIFSLTDAHDNNVAGAVVSCTLVKVTLGEEEAYDVLNLWGFKYDADTELYSLDIATEGLAPGTYDLWLGFDDATQTRLRIELVQGES